jgi:hypothetical protein
MLKMNGWAIDSVGLSGLLEKINGVSKWCNLPMSIEHSDDYVQNHG